eukprot:82471-Chlamydomonas_euryale.AAC.5
MPAASIVFAALALAACAANVANGARLPIEVTQTGLGDASNRRAGRILLGANTYELGQKVPLWASKVGPFSNPRCDPAWAYASERQLSGPSRSCTSLRPRRAACPRRCAVRHMNTRRCLSARPRRCAGPGRGGMRLSVQTGGPTASK